MRAHAAIQDLSGRAIGEITSGGCGPSGDGPVALGYIETAMSAPGTALQVIVRDKPLPAKVEKLPFVPHRYYRS